VSCILDASQLRAIGIAKIVPYLDCLQAFECCSTSSVLVLYVCCSIAVIW
jgi:predicted transcriptional regulator